MTILNINKSQMLMRDSTLKSMFFMSYIIFLALEPPRQVSADLTKAHEILALIQLMVVAYIYYIKKLSMQTSENNSCEVNKVLL